MMKLYEILTEADPTTPEFRRWFGGSKIVDRDGLPMRLYHGTLNDIHVFEPGDGRNGTALGSGVIYFTADPQHAASYGKETPQQARAAGRRFPKEYQTGANITPVYIKMENPLYYAPDMPVGNELVKLAKSRGHDGIVFSTGRDIVNHYREVVVFKPDQIKLALA